MKNHIAFIVGNLGVGGVQQALLELVKLLYANNDITVYYTNNNRIELREKIEKYANTKYIPELSNIRNYTKDKIKQYIKKIKIIELFILLKNIFLYKIKTQKYKDFYLSKIIEKQVENYDIAVSYASLEGFTVEYLFNNISARKKYVWVHSQFDSRCVLPLSIAKANKIITVSKTLESRICREFPKCSSKTTTIYNLIDKGRIIDLSKETIDIDLSNKYVISSVGRLDKIKQYSLAIDACKILKEKGYNIKWLLCGDGEDRLNLENKVKENHLENDFILLGSQSNPYKYVAKSNIFCHTSRSEGYPVVFQEAFLLNKKIVSTNFPGANDIINEKNGIIVEQNPSSIANGIIKMMNNSAKNNLIEVSNSEEDYIKLFNIG